MFRDNPKNMNISFCKRRDNEAAVRPHLAYTAQQAADLTKQGKPISNQQVQGMYYDGEPLSDGATLDLTERRGIDINDVWSDSMDKAAKRRKYGVKSVTNGTDSVDAPKGGK